MRDEHLTSTKPKKPPASETVLFASVLAVAWALVAVVFWGVLAVAFGNSRGNVRLLTMLVIGAIVVAFLCGHAHRQGWKSRR